MNERNPQNGTAHGANDTVEEAHTNLAFKMMCDALYPRLSNREIVDIIHAGTEDKTLQKAVTKSQVEKYKRSFKRVSNGTGNRHAGSAPKYNEMPVPVFEAFVNGLTIYDFGKQCELD